MLNNELQKIYARYHLDGQVIPGGVMNEDKYLSSRTKVMMLMKEVNDPSGKYDWSLPTLLSGIYERKNPFYRMWKNVSRWAICSMLGKFYFSNI